MAYLWIWIFALTMLQLCRAEIPDMQHKSWYSANIIHEGYYPKPISEIFSTEATFSRSNPIIILPKSSIFPNDMIFWSTSAPPLHTFSSSEPLFSKTVALSTPSSIVTSSEEIDTTSSTSSTSRLPKSTRADLTHTKPEESTVESPWELGKQEIKSTEQPKLEETNSTPSSPRVQTTPLVTQPNSDVNYHHIPQSIQSVPIEPQTSSEEPSHSQTSAQTISESTILPQFSSSIIVPSTTPSSTSPSTILHESFSNSPFSSPTYPISSTSFASYSPQSTISDVTSSTLKPTLPLRIRVLAPSRSLTNVRITPTIMVKTPTTIKTRKPKPKNLYKVCMDSCEGPRTPICAAPSTNGLIDPSTLRGFPSICHMACYNTFKEERFEKLVDGRCGKLRTRIRPVDSRNKLKRTELTKTEYTIDNTDTQTVVEFASLV